MSLHGGPRPFFSSDYNPHQPVRLEAVRSASWNIYHQHRSTSINRELRHFPSGKQPHNYQKSPYFHIFHGKIHYFDWAMFNSYVAMDQYL